MLYLNKDWFTKAPIQISHRFHAFGGRLNQDSGPSPLMFEFSRLLKLTSIQVVAVNDIETNKYPHPLWHLISDSNSVPTRGFLYGMEIQGMRPAYKGSAAAPLDPTAKYRLLLQAGGFKAQHDFRIDPAAGP